MKYLKLILLINLFIFISCSKKTKNEVRAFIEKEPQNKTERTVHELAPLDSLNLTEEFEGISIIDLKLDDEKLYLDIGGNNFLVLNAENFDLVNEINIPKGRGPGELLVVRSFDVENETLAILDGNAMKTVLYDLKGNFLEEFLNDEYPVEAIEMADPDTLYYQVKPANKYLFVEADRENNIRHRFQEQMPNINRMATTGEMVYHNNSIYFGGYSEPILHRYDISDTGVKSIFSRAVIDDYNSENNYAGGETSGGSRFWSYSDEAIFASKDIDVDDNFLYSVRHHNDEVGYKYLDIYSTGDGGYLASIKVRHYPYLVAVDDAIYTIESKSGKSYLMKYPKLQFFSSAN